MLPTGKSMRIARHHAVRLLASAAVAALLAMSVGGCTTTGEDTTGSIGSPSAPHSDADSAMNFARALRATGERAQAATVLEQAAIKHPYNKALLGDYGRALADAGDFSQALDVLSRAHTPDAPDWRVLNAQGAVLDQMGRHQDAQRHYASA